MVPRPEHGYWRNEATNASWRFGRHTSWQSYENGELIRGFGNGGKVD